MRRRWTCPPAGEPRQKGRAAERLRLRCSKRSNNDRSVEPASTAELNALYWTPTAMTGQNPKNVTALLSLLRNDDADSKERLWKMMYPEVRRMAAASMRKEQPGHILQPTALANEACIRL